jgi:hypothetical protein
MRMGMDEPIHVIKDVPGLPTNGDKIEIQRQNDDPFCGIVAAWVLIDQGAKRVVNVMVLEVCGE